MAWLYVGWRGTRAIRSTPTGKAESLRRWINANFRLARATEIMPSREHDRRNPESVHREGRGIDAYPADDAEGWRLAHTIADTPGPGDVDLILWKDYQWGGHNGPRWTHTGRRDHDTHLHIEVRP